MAQIQHDKTIIDQLIDVIGPRATQRVLEILGGDTYFTSISIPPSRKLNAMLYRAERNAAMGGAA